jgi:hypothetical protein
MTDPKTRIFIVVGAVGAGLVAALLLAMALMGGGAADGGWASFDEVYSPPAIHPVTIKSPEGLGLLRTHETDALGRPVGVACSTCHGSDARDTRALKERPEQLVEFHTEMVFDHGELSCSSCHHPDDRDQLRLADGQALPFTDVMNLCAQCHGTTYRAYQHGAHGGMKGHWDLSQGPRERNNCISCHNAHAPAYPVVVPAPGPRDRFFNTH